MICLVINKDEGQTSPFPHKETQKYWETELLTYWLRIATERNSFLHVLPLDGRSLCRRCRRAHLANRRPNGQQRADRKSLAIVCISAIRANLPKHCSYSKCGFMWSAVWAIRGAVMFDMVRLFIHSFQRLIDFCSMELSVEKIDPWEK